MHGAKHHQASVASFIKMDYVHSIPACTVCIIHSSVGILYDYFSCDRRRGAIEELGRPALK